MQKRNFSSIFAAARYDLQNRFPKNQSGSDIVFAECKRTFTLYQYVILRVRTR